MDIEKAIERAIGGRAILFLGAGFSTDAESAVGPHMPMAHELTKLLADVAGIEQVEDLEEAAEIYLERQGADSLITFLKRQFACIGVRDHHVELARVPWKRVYTTNYDNVFQTASQRAGRTVTTVTSKDEMRHLGRGETWCVHLNGCIDRLDRMTLNGDFKLLDRAVLDANLADSEWASLIRTDMSTAAVVFFVGYSLYDMDVRRILWEIDDLKEKCFFVVGREPKERLLRRASKFGQVVSVDVCQLATLFAERKKTYIPPEDEFAPLSVQERLPDRVATYIQDKDFHDLLLFGDHDEGRVARSIESGTVYYMRRSATDDFFRFVAEGSRVIAVCSDLGNGKTLFLNGLGWEALKRGYRVFELRHHSVETRNELQQITKLQGNTLTIIEDYFDWLDEIRLFARFQRPSDILVVSARTAVHDVLYDDLCKATGADAIPEILLDYLDARELEWLTDALDRYGLWGDMAGRGRQFKLRHLQETCGGQMHAVLLHLLESQDIGTRFGVLCNEISKNRDYLDVVITISLLTVLSQIPTLNNLADLSDPAILARQKFQADPFIMQLVDFHRNSFVLRSSVAAQFILRNKLDGGSVVRVLVGVAEKLDRLSPQSVSYRRLLERMMRFNILQLVLPEQGKKAAAIRFYENIKNTRAASNNMLFWLQYAIACLSFEDYNKAGRFFSTAYALAKSANKDTFQIDNHYARYLLVAPDEEFPSTVPMERFRQARRIIVGQIATNRRHYPFRVAAQYRDFLERHIGGLSGTDTQEIGNAARYVLERVDRLPPILASHKHVTACREAMKHVLSRVGDSTQA